MDYKGHVCPVCHKTFEKGDDVVVCPVCGTPHHRECYESNGDCINASRHRENYDYKRECEVNSAVDEDITCKICGGKNPADSKFCNSCGASFQPQGTQNTQYTQNSAEQNNQNNQNPQGGFGTTFVFDPLGGVKPDEEVGEGVKASEAAKLVKASTPFYIPQFKQIKTKNRARFSFVGFIFGGGWMLYRKMYKLGGVITAFMALLTLVDVYISVYHKEALRLIGEQYAEAMSGVMKSYGFNSYAALGEFFSSLTQEQVVIFIVSIVAAVLMLLVHVFCGVFGNRWYYKHCMKMVRKVKASSIEEKEINIKLNAKGGVNIPLAICLIASYYIVSYLPMFL